MHGEAVFPGHAWVSHGPCAQQFLPLSFVGCFIVHCSCIGSCICSVVLALLECLVSVGISLVAMVTASASLSQHGPKTRHNVLALLCWRMAWAHVRRGDKPRSANAQPWATTCGACLCGCGLRCGCVPAWVRLRARGCVLRARVQL